MGRGSAVAQRGQPARLTRSRRRRGYGQGLAWVLLECDDLHAAGVVMAKPGDGLQRGQLFKSRERLVHVPVLRVLEVKARGFTKAFEARRHGVEQVGL